MTETTDVMIYKLRDGVAWLTIAPDQLDAAAGELAAQMAANAPLSVRAGKRMIYAVAGLALERAFELADEIWAPTYLSEDAQEGPRAFRERRAPQWKDRKSVV